jgi:diguanylate cyclase
MQSTELSPSDRPFNASEQAILFEQELLAQLKVATIACSTSVSWISTFAPECQVLARIGLDDKEALFVDEHFFDEPVFVIDATQDPRFVHHPLVTGSTGIKFFAGVPIFSLSEVRIGMLWVADRASRTVDAAQLDLLNSLAIIASRTIATLNVSRIQATPSEQPERNKALSERAGAMVGVGAWEVDLVNNSIYWSDETCRIHGVEPGYSPMMEEAIEFYAPEARDVINNAVTEGIATGKGWDLELPFIRKDGARIWVRAAGVAEFSHGSPVRLLGAFQDITDRHAAKVALLQSESQFRGSFEAASHGIALVSTTGRFLQVNKSLCNKLGYSEAELLALDFQTITHPEDLTLDLSHIDDLLAGRTQTYRMEKRYFHKTGRTVWAQLSVSLVRTLEGEPVHFVSQIQDVTKQRYLTDRLRTLLETASDGIHVLDQEGNIVEFSQSFARMLGYSTEETAKLNVQDWDAQLSGDELIAGVKSLLTTERSFETKHRRKDGSIFDVEINAKGIVLDGTPFLYASSRDVTERKKVELALHNSKLFVQNILDSVVSEIAVLDEEGVIVATNEAWRKFATENSNGSAPDAINHIGVNYLRVLEASQNESVDGSEVLTGIKGVIDGQLPRFECEYPCDSLTEKKWFSMTVTPHRTGERGAVVVHTDITAQKQSEELMHSLAFYDSLTQLANRRLLQERLNFTMANNRRSGCYGALIVLDLDNFKPLNDEHGHAVGDLLLKEVANRLRRSVRESDTVARVGGDEFIVVLSTLDTTLEASVNQAKQIAEKIRAQLAAPYALTLQQALSESTLVHHCSSSIGVSLLAPNDSNQIEIFQRADAAMYQAKAAGRDAVKFA